MDYHLRTFCVPYLVPNMKLREPHFPNESHDVSLFCVTISHAVRSPAPIPANSRTNPSRLRRQLQVKRYNWPTVCSSNLTTGVADDVRLQYLNPHTWTGNSAARKRGRGIWRLAEVFRHRPMRSLVLIRTPPWGSIRAILSV